MKWAWSALSVLTGNLVRMRGPAGHGAVYLTFDDGPDEVHTPVLLDLLARHGAKGTFFVTGVQARKFPDLVRRLVAEGHAIGNHSMTHPRMENLGAKEQWAELDAAESVLQGFDGQGSHLVRPPHGRLTIPLIRSSMVGRRVMMLWTIDSLDYRLRAEDVARHLKTSAPRPGDVVLFHDDSPVASEVLAALLPQWSQAGFSFPTLS